MCYSAEAFKNDKLHDVPVMNQNDGEFGVDGVQQGLNDAIPTEINPSGMWADPEQSNPPDKKQRPKLIQFTPTVYKTLAGKKLDAEEATFSGDVPAMGVYRHVADTMRKFFSVSEKFAEVFYLTKSTLSDCCRDILKGCGQSISDIEVYRRAAQFYFPNSEISFLMEIRLVGSMPTEAEMRKGHHQATTTVPAVKSKPVKKAKPKQEAKKKVSEPVIENAAAAGAPAVEQIIPAQAEDEIIQISLF